MSTHSKSSTFLPRISVAAGDRLVVFLMTLCAFALYLSTAAQGTIFGDPSEYQFIPGIWGIAHPPGYAFYTLVAGIWQRLLPFGSMAWRANALASLMGAWIVSRVASIVLAILRLTLEKRRSLVWPARLMAIISASLVMLASDVWQHSIHSNAHIMSAAISATQLWLCIRWYITENDMWLYALAFSCGIGVTHHPITVWSLPAYALFIIVRRPTIWKEWRTLLFFIISGLCGLAPWLYFPLRSPTAPFGPTDMATWEGFLRHATAQGLRVNLFHFGVADQWNRWRVFWSLTQLQYPFAFAILVLPGIVWLWKKHRTIAVLFISFLIGHLLFTLNSVQDVMAYLLHPFVVMAIPLALGIWWITEQWYAAKHGALVIWIACALIMLYLWVPALDQTYADISLRGWGDADAYVSSLRDTFDGTGEGAAIVSDWEHLTPYYYYAYVEGLHANPDDYHPEFVSGAMPWVESVFAYLPAGPVYLTNYRPDVRDLGFRLRPEGALWRVLEPPATEAVNPQVQLNDVWIDGQMHVLGYDLDLSSAVKPGDILPITLYATLPETTTELLMPRAMLGEISQAWMTDSRLLTWDWLAGEIIVEKYEIYIPYTAISGSYPLVLGFTNVLEGRTAEILANDENVAQLRLGDVLIAKSPATVSSYDLKQAVANIGNDVLLSSIWARSGLRVRRDTWDQPLELADNRVLNLTLYWNVLTQPKKNYTVFIHLLDGNGQPVFIHDYTPLGGAFPSYLWFPKWLPGQEVTDPYRLVIPETIPSGTYSLEIGMYELGSIRRIPQLDANGNMTGDRLILGSISID